MRNKNQALFTILLLALAVVVVMPLVTGGTGMMTSVGMYPGMIGGLLCESSPFNHDLLPLRANHVADSRWPLSDRLYELTNTRSASRGMPQSLSGTHR
jgi:hypothetical protein